VDESGFKPVIPPSILENTSEEPGMPTAMDIFTGVMEHIQEAYADLKALGIPKEDARFVLPNACQTELVLTTNASEFRHIFSQRCAKDAQWEIRAVCEEMLRQLLVVWPHVFDDQKRLLSENQENMKKELVESVLRDIKSDIEEQEKKKW